MSKTKEKKDIQVIDLFSGCGGLSLHFMGDGYNIVKAVEYDPVIANTYMKNHPNIEMIVDDIKNVDSSGVFKEGDADVIVGGPPCQGFSMAGARIRHGFIEDPRNYLFKHYFNVVKAVKPKVFIMENVKGMMTMEKGKIFEEILSIFHDSKLLDGKPYNLTYRLVKANEYGIPQRRERLIIVGSNIENIDLEQLWEKTFDDVRSEVPHFFDNVTVEDAIGNMPQPTDDGIVENPRPVTEYQRYLASSKETISNHSKSRHSRKAIERMESIGVGENFESLNEDIKSVHSGSYGRLSWDEPAMTITTRFDTPAGGRFIHPVENRTLTHREAARIQSFPDDFEFYGDRRSIARQIGNAVPPKISFFLSRLVRNILESE